MKQDQNTQDGQSKQDFLGCGGFLETLYYVLTWYASNMAIIMLNKYLLSYYGFSFPIFLTMCHMIACGLLTSLAGLAGVFVQDKIKSRDQLVKVGCLSAIFVGSVMMGNMSLRYIAVSFSQALSSTTPFFVAVLAAMLQGKMEHFATYATLVPVVLGTVIASNGEPDLHILGLTLCLLSTLLRGLKSVVQAILMSSPEEKLNSQSLLMYMSPIAVIWLLPFVIIAEPEAAGTLYTMLTTKSEFIILFLLNLGSAYFVNLFNFLVTKHLGALTLQVLGNLKGVVAAIISVGIFQNPITPLGIIGFSVTVWGGVLYKEAKTQFPGWDAWLKQ